MPDYKKGKIYKIVSVIGNNVYIGSTIQKLCQRLTGHRVEYKRHLLGKRICKSSCFDVLKHGDAKIYLIESYPCDNKIELLKREGYYIMKNECVNKRIAGQTDTEYKKTEHYKKLSYDYQKTDKYKKKRKIYRETEQYKQLMNGYRARISICYICGKNIKLVNKQRHFKSVYCQRFRENPFCESNI